MRTLLKWVVIVTGLVIAGLVVLVFIFDWNWVKGIVTSQASAALGRQVRIEGDLDVALSWQPRIQVDGIHVANAEWSDNPHLLSLRRLTVQIDLRELLRGRIVLPTIEILEPVVWLERSEQGQGNWPALADSKEPKAQTELPTVGQLSLRDGRLNYHDRATATQAHTSLVMNAGANQAVSLQSQGQIDDEPLELKVQAGALVGLEQQAPYPLQTQLKAGAWQAKLDGTLIHPLQLQSADLNLLLEGKLPDALLTVLHAPLTRLPKHRITARVTH